MHRPLAKTQGGQVTPHIKVLPRCNHDAMANTLLLSDGRLATGGMDLAALRSPPLEMSLSLTHENSCDAIFECLYSLNSAGIGAVT